MAQIRVDEVLEPVGTDQTVIPRYNLVDATGNVLASNVKLVLQNVVVTEGMPVGKTTFDECLAASGVTTGSASALVLNQDNFVLFDGALIRFKLHIDSGATPTINVSSTGAKKLMQSATKPMKAGIKAGTWLTAVYSSTFDFFVLQGSSDDTKKRETFKSFMSGRFVDWRI